MSKSKKRLLPEEEPNFARQYAAEEAERLRKLGWSEEEIDKALGAWR
jgi:hypothetical protein